MQTAGQGEEALARTGFGRTAAPPRPPADNAWNPILQQNAALTPADAVAWKSVRRGILFLTLGWLALAACFLSFQGIENLVLRRTSYGMQLPPPTSFDLIVLILCLLPPLAHVLLAFRGEIDCLAVPGGNARSWAVVGFCLHVGLFLIAATLFFMEAVWASCLHAWFMAVPSDDPAYPNVAGYASQTDVEAVMVLFVWAVPLLLARWVIFLLFLRAVAKEVGASWRLVRSLSLLTAIVAIAPVAGPPLIYSFITGLNGVQPSGGFTYLLFGCGEAAVVLLLAPFPLALLLWNVTSISLVRDAVTAYLHGRPGG